MNDGKINHISDTAIWVAMYRAQESMRPDALFKDPYAKMLAGEKGEKILQNIRYSKNIAPYLILRTKVLDDLLMMILKQNEVDAVINLASGLDTRPYRLDLRPSLKWYDVDLPDINNYKKEKMKNEKPKCHLEYVALDLSDVAQRKLFFDRVNAESQCVFVITEGFIIYLDPETVKALALDMHRHKKFMWWLTDFSTSTMMKYMKPRMRKTLGNNQFKFSMDPGPEMMRAWHWSPHDTRYGWQESLKLNRPFPTPWHRRLLMRLIPKKTLQKMLVMSGFTLLKRVS